MRRGSIVRTLGAALVALVLVACRVDTTVDVKVLPDGTGIVTVTVVADRDVVVGEPGLAKDLRYDDLRATGWTVTGPTTMADGGLRVVVTHTFADTTQANVILRSITGPTGILRKPGLVAKGARGDIRWTLTGRLDFSTGLSALADQQLLATIGGAPFAASLSLHNVTAANVATFTMKVELPGRPIGADGKPVPEPAPAFSWSVRPGDAPVDVAARTTLVSEKVAKARRLERKVATILGIYVLVLTIAAIIWWKWRQRRRSRAGRADGDRGRPSPARSANGR